MNLKLLKSKMNDKTHNRLLLKIILTSLDGYIKEQEDDSTVTVVEDKGKFSYLLGQAIRHWVIPDGNWHTSKAAQLVWDAIVETNLSSRRVKTYHTSIDKLRYKEAFITKKDVGGWTIPRFKGNTKDFINVDPLRLQGGKPYVFNNIFIAEHTIPVSDIIEVLAECYHESQSIKEMRTNVKNILNRIHITQMLKIEDRRISECQSRIGLVKGNASPYDYLLNTDPQNVYQAIVGECYNTPSYVEREWPFCPDIENQKNQPWAQALNLSKPYTIEIAKKKPL